MKIIVSPDKAALGAAAAAAGAAAIRSAIHKCREATIIVATGASQFEMLDALVKAPGIDWSRVRAFHLDEYIGLPASHAASFRRYLRERFVDRLPDLGAFFPIQGCALDTNAEIARLNTLLRDRVVDVCFAGIGENGHLAFNDPPADFVTRQPYIRVDLDEACRRQQLGEGWFPSLDAVPRQAISMSIAQIMKSRELILSVPDARKAEAVAHAVDGEVSPLRPASIVQRHGCCTLFLDPSSAARLKSAAPIPVGHPWPASK